MRPFLFLLFAGAVVLSWQQGWLSKAVAVWSGTSADSHSSEGLPTLEERIASRVLTERLRLNVPPLVSDPEIQQWLMNNVESGAKNLDSIARSVRQTWPQYQDVRVLQTYSMFADGILEHITSWPDARVPELTHLSVALKPGTCGIGWHATVLAGVRLPMFSTEALDDPKQNQFYNNCTLCKHGQACQIPRNARAFKLRCHVCLQVYAMYAADSEGRFRHVNEFLTGYVPPAQYPPGQSKLAELMNIWRAQTGRCRYLTDGRNDDNDAWQTAEETQTLGQGDCEDSAILLADWLLARGFQARVAIGTYEAQGGPHAWVVARLDGNDYLLESTEFPFTLQRPPLLHEVGLRYVPELLFDRLAIFTLKQPNAAWNGDLWGEDTWQRVATTETKAEVRTVKR